MENERRKDAQKRYYENPRYKKQSNDESVQKPHRKPFSSNPNKLLISIVIPSYNEEESIPELVLQLEEVLDKIANERYEIIFIDDGSTDKTFDAIKQAKARNKAVKGIRFRRNFGKSAALAVGFAEAEGLVVVTMDSDLQDDPKEIPNLLTKLKEGYDLVSGWKKVRHDPKFTKNIPSKFFNWATSKASGVKLHDFNCGLKAYRKEVVKYLNVYGEMHRFLPALAHLGGFRVTELPVLHHARKYGKTKFGLNRFVNGFLDLLTVIFTTKYVKRPMHLFGSLGAITFLAGFGISGWLAIEWALGWTTLSNRPLTLLGVLLIIVGIQFFSMGLISELIVKNNANNQGQKYTIKEKI